MAAERGPSVPAAAPEPTTSAGTSPTEPIASVSRPIIPNWRLDNGHLLQPEQAHLVAVCTRAARLHALDRRVPIDCIWPPSPSSQSPAFTTNLPPTSRPVRLYVQYSRLFIHGGPLLALARPFFPAPVPPIRLYAPVTVVRVILDFLYCAAIDFRLLPAPHVIHVAFLAHRLACPQLHTAALFHMACFDRLRSSTNLRLASTLVPLASDPLSPFHTYYFETARAALPTLPLVDTVPVAWASLASPGPSANFHHRVMDRIVSSAMLTHEQDVRVIVPLFAHFRPPPSAAVYIVARISALYYRIVADFHSMPSLYSPVTPDSDLHTPLSTLLPGDDLRPQSYAPNQSVDDLAYPFTSPSLPPIHSPYPPLRPLTSLSDLWRILVSARLAEQVIAKLATSAIDDLDNVDDDTDGGSGNGGRDGGVDKSTAADDIGGDGNGSDDSDDVGADSGDADGDGIDDETGVEVAAEDGIQNSSSFYHSDDSHHDSVLPEEHQPIVIPNYDEVRDGSSESSRLLLETVHRLSSQQRRRLEEIIRVLLAAVLRYVEPWVRDDAAITRMVHFVTPLVLDPRALFRDDSLVGSWSSRAIRLAAVALLCDGPAANSTRLQHGLPNPQMAAADAHSIGDGGASIVVVISQTFPGDATDGQPRLNVRGGRATVQAVRVSVDVDMSVTDYDEAVGEDVSEFGLWLRWQADVDLVAELSFWCRPLQGRCPCINPAWRADGWGQVLLQRVLPPIVHQGERLLLDEDDVQSWFTCHRADCRLMLSVDVRVVLRE